MNTRVSFSAKGMTQRSETSCDMVFTTRTGNDMRLRTFTSEVTDGDMAMDIKEATETIVELFEGYKYRAVITRIRPQLKPRKARKTCKW